MTFTVTYRGASGAPTTETVEAADRADCLAQLKARGIAPTGVKEGGAKRDGKDVGDSAKNTGRNGVAYVLLAACVLLAVIGGIWWIGRDKAQPSQDGEVVRKPSALAKEVKPAAAPKPTEPVAAPVAAEPERKTPPGGKLPREERIAMIERHIRERPLDLSPRTNRAFRTGIEQSLAAMFTTPLGAPPPLIPMRMTPVTYLRLQEILDAPNEILETDTDKVVESKMAVAEAKKALKEYIDKGGDPEKFMEFYYSELKQSHEEWKAAQFKLIETMKTDPGLAPTMEAEVNENFKARGIRPIKMPPKLKERYGIQ